MTVLWCYIDLFNTIYKVFKTALYTMMVMMMMMMMMISISISNSSDTSSSSSASSSDKSTSSTSTSSSMRRIALQARCVFRFVFLALGPMEGKNIREYEELGRAAGTLFSDKVKSP